MKVKPKKKKQIFQTPCLIIFFKGDENYAGDVEASEEERLDSEYQKLIEDLIDIGCHRDFQEKHHKDLFEWIDAVDGVVKKAKELLRGEQSAKM